MATKSKEFEFWRLLGEIYFSTDGSMYLLTSKDIKHTCYFHIHKISKDGNNALQIHLLNFGLVVGIIDAKTPPPPNHPISGFFIKRCFMQLYQRARRTAKPSY